MLQGNLALLRGLLRLPQNEASSIREEKIWTGKTIHSLHSFYFFKFPATYYFFKKKHYFISGLKCRSGSLASFYHWKKVKNQSVSCSFVSDPATSWTIACHAPLSKIHQARMLEWVPIPFSRGPSRPRDWNRASLIAGRFFTGNWGLKIQEETCKSMADSCQCMAETTTIL